MFLLRALKLARSLHVNVPDTKNLVLIAHLLGDYDEESTKWFYID